MPSIEELRARFRESPKAAPPPPPAAKSSHGRTLELPLNASIHRTKKALRGALRRARWPVGTSCHFSHDVNAAIHWEARFKTNNESVTRIINHTVDPASNFITYTIPTCPIGRA